MAMGSGVMYALVVLFLRYLCQESSAWLTALNLIGSATVIGGFVLVKEGAAGFAGWATALTWKQLAFLAFFGAVQMATPYFLFARGLRSVGTQEAAIITLLEPVLNPVWAYLIAPEKDAPTVWTFVGGFLLLAALGWRYLPGRRPLTPPTTPESSTGPSPG
jgi:drug/metabolite transporter (DMT)-like permease